jgi:BirA family biotin operon repressor/biotin-[acetyl-CoA-carboxylase] ligase
MRGGTGETPIEMWQDAVEAVLRQERLALVRRVMVLAETESTQDAALRASADGVSSLVVADRQTGGRGRLGRQWVQGEAPDEGPKQKAARGLGVAATFALVKRDVPPARLSIAAGLAACRACEVVVGAGVGPSAGLGLRWPNDVVERGGGQRKLAGVLVETKGETALVGIGINVGHEAEDFPAVLGGRAASTAMLGSATTRLDVLIELVRQFDQALGMDPESLAAEWSRRDILVGSRRTFEHAGHRYEGTVQGVQPTSHIDLVTEDGRRVQLPALTTSLVHE